MSDAQNFDPMPPLRATGAMRGMLGPIVRRLNRISRKLNSMQFVKGGRVEIRKDAILLWGSASGVITGTVYVLGRKNTGLNSDATKPWIEGDVTTGAAVEFAGPPADPWPPNKRYREKAHCSGDIYIDA